MMAVASNAPSTEPEPNSARPSPAKTMQAKLNRSGPTQVIRGAEMLFVSRTKT